MKVLWTSNAPWSATGYGSQTKLFTPKLNEHYDVALFATYGLQGDKSKWGDMVIYPAGFDAYGNDIIFEWAMEHFEGDPNVGWLVILYDAWVYARPEIGQLHNAVWVPVDHDPLPAPVHRYFQEFNGLPICMSEFGVEKFAQADIEALYVPHGIPELFEPKPRSDARHVLSVPEDAFVVGMNAANKGKELHRKGFSQAFEGFTRFAQTHADAILYVHTEKTGIQGTVGWNLEEMARVFGIEDRVVFADQHAMRSPVPTAAMPWLYSGFDVFLNPAYGEGFGIPIVEAQACGVPVVVTNHTSMRELCGDGWAVGGVNMYHEKMRAFWKVPDPAQIAEALEEAYKRPQGPSEKAVDFAADYRADRVFENHMLPVFNQLEERINPKAAA